jgi:hypothetical protein
MAINILNILPFQRVVRVLTAKLFYLQGAILPFIGWTPEPFNVLGCRRIFYCDWVDHRPIRIMVSYHPYRLVSTLFTPIWRIRLPFYWETRTLFLLYLSLPQTQVRSRLLLYLSRFSHVDRVRLTSTKPTLNPSAPKMRQNWIPALLLLRTMFLVSFSRAFLCSLTSCGPSWTRLLSLNNLKMRGRANLDNSPTPSNQWRGFGRLMVLPLWGHYQSLPRNLVPLLILLRSRLHMPVVLTSIMMANRPLRHTHSPLEVRFVETFLSNSPKHGYSFLFPILSFQKEWVVCI